jgi:hypothetical protein
MLVIPGVTAPARTARKPAVATETKAAEPPPLAGPATSSAAPRSTKPASSAAIPLTLEPIPAGEDVQHDAGTDLHEPKRTRPTPTSPPSQAQDKPRTTKPETPAPASGVSRYTPGAMLGRILGSDEEGSDAKNAIRVESRSDPAVEAAVKRRVEQKIQETLGDRVNSVEVRVKGRTVVIRARASHFWYRRTVRRTLETLPMPSGYRSRAELID